MKKWLVFFLTFGIIAPLAAAPTVALGLRVYSARTQAVAPPATWLDTLRTTDWPAVRTQAAWSASELVHERRRGVLWWRVVLANTSLEADTLYLEMAELAGPKDFYVANQAADTAMHLRVGDGLAAVAHLPLYHDMAGLVIPPGQTRTVYARVAYPWYYAYWLDIYAHTGFEAEIARRMLESRSDITQLFLLEGVFLFQCVFVLFLWMLAWRPYYLYYLAYILVLCFYFYAQYRHLAPFGLRQALVPPPPEPIRHGLPFLSYFFYYRFVRHFLDLSHRDVRLNQRVRYIEGITLAYALLGPMFFFPWPWLESVRSVVYPLVSIMLLVGTCYVFVRLWRQRTLLVRLILIGSAFFTLSALLAFSATMFNSYAPQLLEIGFLQINHMMWGLLLELLFFSSALAYKFRLDELENLRAQATLIGQMRENASLRDKLQTIRNRISRDLHDDVGATLSSIAIYSEVARRQAHDRPAVQDLLEKIIANAREMVAYMNDTVWTLNPRHDHTSALLLRMEDFGAALTGAQQIRFDFEADGQLMAYQLPMEQRKNLYLIFKEALHNAVRHGQCGQIRVHLRKVEAQLTLEIRDDGVGFDPAATGHGNGLRNLEARARELDATYELRTAPGQGTTIRLGLPLVSPQVGIDRPAPVS